MNMNMNNDGNQPQRQQQQQQQQPELHLQQQHNQGFVSDADLSNPPQNHAALNPYLGENVWPWDSMEIPPMQQLPPQHAVAMAQYYETLMRGHAAAYASAAAGAALVAAQIATGGVAAGHFPSLPPPPHLHLPGSGGYYTDPITGNPIPPPVFLQPGEFACGSFGSPMGAANWSQHPHHDYDSDHERNSRRRKRQQRMSPSSSNNGQGGVPFISSPFAASYAGSQASEERRGRRRLRSDAGSSGDNHESLNKQSIRRNKEIQFGLSSSDGGGSSSVGGLHRHKKKQRQPSDASLLGKTGVSALHEWCDKRKVILNFILVQDAASNNSLFEFAVQLDGKERGRGRGGTKGSAKQEAARKALQNVFPGVVFNEGGILVDLPPKERETSKERKSKSSLSMLEDLAPNLAKSLAIGQDDDTCGRNLPAGRAPMSKRTRDFYPGTSTTSDDEDENTFYASRGANVCSTLLHAMVQIDDRISDPPSYSYEVAQIPASSNTLLRAKGVSSSTVVAHRGAFTCTATLRLVIPSTNGDGPVGSTEATIDETTERASHEEYDASYAGGNFGDAAGDHCHQPALENDASGDEGHNRSNSIVQILRAVGTGGTKKEARHVASARLLELLFPECNGMVEVKAAADAAREKYAATKALKQQSKRNSVVRDTSQWQHDRRNSVGTNGQLMFALPLASDPPLELDICRQLEVELGLEENEEGHIKNNASDCNKENSEWRFGRQKQLDDLVDAAIQKMYEIDEEGRFIHELSADDVGRTVLRRAGPDDAYWVDKLLSQTHQKRIRVRGAPPSTTQIMQSAPLEHEPQFCPGPIVTLLLCRAIAPHEDPPLGYAVLTLGFSMNMGKSLKVAQLANEPHLPKERLIECLQAFATHMKSSFDCDCWNASNSRQSEKESQRGLTIDAKQLRSIAEAHIHRVPPNAESLEPRTSNFSSTGTSNRFSDERKMHLGTVGVANTLQSVQEESEGSEESDKGNESSGEKRNVKQRDKPSKRSRVN